MRSVVFALATVVLLASTGERSALGRPATSASVTIVHTAGLGTILTGVRGIDRSTSEAVAKRLAQLRARYGEAVFVDGGDALGPMVVSETQFGLSTYKVLDHVGYAAAALSARDGLHTFSFYRLLPPSAELELTLVGMFDRPTTPRGACYPIRPAWAKVRAAGGAQLQIFAVSTTRPLRAIAEPVLLDVQLPGDISAQAKWIEKQLLPGCIPVILSDMAPDENDRLARRLARNAIIFESGYPWRLAGSHAGYKRRRSIDDVLIVSHFSPGEADVVVLPDNLRCSRARVRSETLWKPKGPPEPSFLQRLLGGRPLEARLVRSWFTGTFYLPDIGTTISAQSALRLIKRMNLPYEDRRRVPAKGDRLWRPPRWMEESRHLRGNDIIYRYELYFNKRRICRVYRIRHILVPGFTVVDMLVAVDGEHRLRTARLFSPAMITHRPVRLEPVLKRLEGKRSHEIQLQDWPERAGAEFVVDNVVRDIQMLLAWDEEFD